VIGVWSEAGWEEVEIEKGAMATAPSWGIFVHLVWEREIRTLDVYSEI